MAAAVYSTNLTDITLAQATTGFTAVGGGGSITAETDFYIQDGLCVSKATAATWDTAGTARGGVMFNNGSGITIPTDGAVLTWMYWWGPGVLATKANGGAEVCFGNSTTTYYAQYVSGSDDWEFGGWRCYPVDPNLTQRDRTQGTPNGTWQWFGWQANVGVSQSIGKGNPYGIDAIRYGRCDLVSTNGDLANGYATFLGAASWDNDSTRRLGLLTPQNGAYYMQGLFQMGAAGTPVDFRDANRVIFVQNTEKVSANFNLFEVRNASSRVDWTSISIQALGTNAKGRFLMTDNADVNKDGCTFTDMDTFVYQSNATIDGTTFRRCGQITLGGATMTNCLVTRSTAAIALKCGSSVSTLSNTDFVSSGTGHALEITSGSTHTLNNITFTGYASSNGSTGNEAVYVNISSGTVTIYADSTFSYRTAGATVIIVAGAVTATLIVQDVSGNRISGAQCYLGAGNTDGDLPYQETVTITNNNTTATVTHSVAHNMSTGDKVRIKGANHWQNNGVFEITVTSTTQYTYIMSQNTSSNPTGTITATWVGIYGTTDINGTISVTRVFSIDQPVSGWARKASSAPYYKTGPVSGIIDSSNGASLTALLTLDQ